VTLAFGARAQAIPAAAPPVDVGVGEALVRSLSTLTRGQIVTGEVATYFRQPVGGLAYLRSPLPSAYVHDALGCFDPSSAWVEPALFDHVPAPARVRFVRAIGDLRRRVRAFLAWQEEPDGCWRFFGRGSGEAPDADTTAVAAAALLDLPRRTMRRPWARHAGALAALAPAPDLPADLTAAANVLRFLALVGEEVGDRIDGLLARLRGPLGPGSHRYASPLAPAYALARAWTAAHLPRRDELAALVLPRVLALQGADGRFGGPAATALGLSVLHDLGHRGPEVARAVAALLGLLGARGGWAFDPLFRDGGGSLACSTALAMSALARAGASHASWTAGA
jgi:hypothetical protein